MFTAMITFAVALGVAGQYVEADSAEFHFVVAEEQAVGSIVVDLVADADLRQTLDRVVLDALVFDVFHGPHSELFDVDSPSGIVRVKRVIDRDVICYKQPTCVIPLDVAIVRPSAQFRVFKLSLTVNDVNDNNPVFEPPLLTLRVPETASRGSVYALPAAVDRDYGPRDVQSYAMTSNATERFRLHVTGTGSASDVQLVVVGQLDHESESVYMATVTAVDGGSPAKSGSLDVVILIQDANDHAPVFDRPGYSATVREDFPVDSVILSVHASDADRGPNAEVVYSLAGSTAAVYGHLFAVDPASGALTLRQLLDYETAAEYSLLVAASDRGPSPTPVYTKVTISVQDLNDNAPAIRVNALTAAGDAEIEEHLPAGSFVAHVSVVDLDTGSSGQVTCELQRAGGVFTLQPLARSTSTEYKLVTSSELDREDRDEYQLTIDCRDAGVPPLSQSRDLVVRVVDTNDHAPQFQRRSYTASVREDAEVGLPLLKLTATDRDVGDNGRVQFMLCGQSTNSTASDLVAMAADTGWLTTAASLDYETVHEVEVCIAAVDGGQPTPRSTTVTVTVNIVDVNDSPPRFTQSSYTFGTYENQPVDTEIGRLVAVDPDSPPHDQFLFAVVSETPPIGAFVVDRRSGRLATARELDRELTRVHHVVVAATDLAEPRLSSAVNVTVFVADRNDNAPVISFPRPGNDSVEVSRYAPAGYVISRVFAHDADFANNARLSYHVVRVDGRPSVGGLFDVDPDLGAVSVAGDLRQADRDRYDLVLAVTDGGVPAQSAVVTLTIDVVSKAWSEPHAASGLEDLNNDGASSVGAVFLQHRLILVLLAVITVFLTVLLVLAIVCVKCRQRRYLARKRTNMPLCNVDSNVRKNLIIDNVQRTNDVSVTSETSAARPSSPLMNSVHRTDEGSVTPAYFDSETHAGLLAQPRLHFQRPVNPHIRTLALPVYSRPQSSTQLPSSFYSLDARCHGMLRPSAYYQQQQQSVRRQYNNDNNDGDGLEGHHLEVPEEPCSPTESDSTSGCSSAPASNSDRDGSPRHPAVHVADQPPPSPPSTQPDVVGGPSTCCGCTGDREGSTRPGDRSVSRGAGYCCTVQPLDRPVTPLASHSPPSPTAAAPTPQPADWPSGTCSDELLLTPPRLVSPADRRSTRPQPPPLPPPRRTSLKGDRN